MECHFLSLCNWELSKQMTNKVLLTLISSFWEMNGKRFVTILIEDLFLRKKKMVAQWCLNSIEF